MNGMSPFDIDYIKSLDFFASSVAGPIFGVVAAIGVIYCIILGAKLAKAEEPGERESAKKALKNAFVGFVLIFILLIVIYMVVPKVSGNNQGTSFSIQEISDN